MNGRVMPPNFVLLDVTLPDVARLVAAMVKARDLVESRSWSHPQEPTTEEWWADVLADPRARIPKRRSDHTAKQAFYRLADELRDTILVACSKCEWKAAFGRDELITAHGAACPMPSLLEHLVAPGCAKVGSQWDHCGVYYVEPIERSWRSCQTERPRQSLARAARPDTSLPGTSAARRTATSRHAKRRWRRSLRAGDAGNARRRSPP
jgi:hypothetical protein